MGNISVSFYVLECLQTKFNMSVDIYVTDRQRLNIALLPWNILLQYWNIYISGVHPEENWFWKQTLHKNQRP